MCVFHYALLQSLHCTTIWCNTWYVAFFVRHHMFRPPPVVVVMLKNISYLCSQWHSAAQLHSFTWVSKWTPMHCNAVSLKILHCSVSYPALHFLYTGLTTRSIMGTDRGRQANQAIKWRRFLPKDEAPPRPVALYRAGGWSLRNHPFQYSISHNPIQWRANIAQAIWYFWRQ